MKGQTALAFVSVMVLVLAECSGGVGCVFMNALKYMRSWVCLVCVCVCARLLWRGWLCLKVVSTVYTKAARKKSASLVDPV